MFKIFEVKPDKNRLIFELKKIGVDDYALSLHEKGEILCLKILNLTPGQANILKQEALAVGADVAVAKGAVTCKIEKTDALLLITKKSIRNLIRKLKLQPFNLDKLAIELEQLLKQKETSYFVAKDVRLPLDKPYIVGILNVTPDSFSDGGKYLGEKSIDARLDYFLENEIKIVDIGGESTRPGAEPVSAKNEIKRIAYAIKRSLEKGFVVSVDTYKSVVAEFALKEGVHIINDISGFNFDNNMAEVCARYGCGVCLMHIKGTPKNMQDNPTYNNLLEDIKLYLKKSIDIALKCGVSKNSIMLDPGFGFGKTLDDNYLILKYLEEIKTLGYPLFIGVSRKSMIGKIIDKTPEERDVPSKAIEFLAMIKGANFIRTHEVKYAKDIAKIAEYYSKVELNA
ncbi:dihydropteroate synthase [Deferribacter desulfuricans SSM1]|uniref:dihydropteroate synthase n=1 Tax=Deferribacter desulfuricans (strain DSM 14783 / JCM 11476 / NBRC 101012 / SSM1) TaxID=639282 RepID=D3PD27_DEFDS|nr:dihydropteroate synthase [Deferribacter desulfuricans]BAI80500.1 dihydropteroate synthase [Deferribacter desulfuricans SSM1]